MAKTERPKMGDLIKQLPTVETPVQEVVRPVEQKKPEAEEQERISGIWVPKPLTRKLKVHAATTDMTQREIIIAALEMYLDK